MIHRHHDHPEGTPPVHLGAAAIDDLLDLGDLEDWAPLARAVAGEPWGRLSDTILRLCAAYGTSRLWQGYVGPVVPQPWDEVVPPRPGGHR